jgi:uncharacterized protein DUF3551
MIRTILVAAAALASVSLSPRYAEASEAPWCAVYSMGEEAVYWDCQYRSFEECRPSVAGAIRARTTSPRPAQSTGSLGNIALARSSSVTTGHVVMAASGTKRTIQLRPRFSAFGQ